MTIIEQIKSYIERQIKDPIGYCYGVSSINKLRELLDFIGTLEAEKPVPADPEEAADVEFDSQVFGKVMSDILAVYKSPSNPEEEPFDYEWTIARQFYELGCRAGAKWHKAHMMLGAVEGEFGYFSNASKTILPSGKLNIKEGDKVRVIICKKEG